MNGNEIESVIRPILVCERLKLEDLQKSATGETLEKINNEITLVEKF